MTLGLTLFFVWLRLRWLAFVRPDASLKVKVAASIIIVPLVAYPFTYGPVWWLRGLTGDLSIVSLLLLGAAVYQQLFTQILMRSQEQRQLQWVVVVIGVVFYPLALGLGQFDPYVLGYDDVYLVGCVLLLSLIAFSQHYYGLAAVLLLTVLAWNMQLLQSVNLWDYLIDPFVFFFFLGSVIRCKR